MWYTATSASVSNGSELVVITSGDDISLVQENSGLVFEDSSPVEVLKAYVDTGGNKVIQLARPWPYSTKTNQPLIAYPTDADFAAATAELRRVINSLEKAGTIDAQEGTDDDKFMTALKTKQSIDFNTGTAAAADVTSSPTDTTAGKLTKVGDFGLGGSASINYSGNLDNVITSSWGYDSDYTIGVSSGLLAVVTNMGSNANQGFQFGAYVAIGDGATGSIYSRRKWQGTWQDWTKFYDSRNTNFNEFGGIAENKVLATGTMFTSTTARFYLPINSKVQPSSITTVGGFRVVTSQTIIATGVPVSMSFPTSEKMVVLDVTVPSTAIGTPVNLRGETAASKITVNF